MEIYFKNSPLQKFYLTFFPHKKVLKHSYDYALWKSYVKIYLFNFKKKIFIFEKKSLNPISKMNLKIIHFETSKKHRFDYFGSLEKTRY